MFCVVALTNNTCLILVKIDIIALLTLLIKVDKVTFLVVNHVLKCSFPHASVSTASNDNRFISSISSVILQLCFV